MELLLIPVVVLGLWLIKSTRQYLWTTLVCTTLNTICGFQTTRITRTINRKMSGEFANAV